MATGKRNKSKILGVVYTQSEVPAMNTNYTFTSPNELGLPVMDCYDNKVTVDSKNYTRAPQYDSKEDTQTLFFEINLTSSPYLFTIPFLENTNFNITVDWGDGVIENKVGSVISYTQTIIGNLVQHTYLKAGTYQIKVISNYGKIPYVMGKLSGSTLYGYHNDRITKIKSAIPSMYEKDFSRITEHEPTDYFLTYRASYLTQVPTDLIKKNNLPSYRFMFHYDAVLENTINEILNFPEDISSREYYDTHYYNLKLSATVDFSRVKSIGSYGLYETFSECTKVTLPNDHLNFSNLISVNDYSLYYTFFKNKTIKSVDFSKLESIASYALHGCLSLCSGLTTINFSNLKIIENSGMNGTFSSCGLSSVTLDKLNVVKSSGMNNCFYECPLEDVSLPELTTVENNGLYSCFKSCSKLTELTLPKISSLGSSALAQAFSSCTSLKYLSFPSLTANSFGTYTNQFNNMLLGVTGCTVHFPASIKNTIKNWADTKAGFGGTNTIIKYDIGGLLLHFNVTPTAEQIYIDGDLISGTSDYVVQGDTIEYMIYKPQYPLLIKQYEVPQGTVATITEDLSSYTAKTLTLNITNVEDAEVTISANGINFTPYKQNPSTYTFSVAQDMEVTYTIKAKGYAKVQNTVNITGDQTIQIEMTPRSTVVEIDLQPYAETGTLKGWRVAETVANPTTNMAMYESTNYHIASSYSVMKVTIEGYNEFTFYINSYGESGWDYTCVSQLDASTYPTSNSGTYANTYSFSKDPAVFGESNYKTVTFSNLGGGEHHIYITYRKDGSGDSYNDRGYILINENQ